MRISHYSPSSIFAECRFSRPRSAGAGAGPWLRGERLGRGSYDPLELRLAVEVDPQPPRVLLQSLRSHLRRAPAPAQP